MTQKSPTILVRHTDHRTPLEKALGVDDSTTKDRFATPQARKAAEAIRVLRARGIKVIELPNGGWSVTPNYPDGATDEEKAYMDVACYRELWSVAGGAR